MKSCLMFIVLIIVFCVAFVYYEDKHINEVVRPEQYRIWVKHTGNPNNITFEEWKLLIHNQPSNTVTPIVIPIVTK